MVGAGGQPIRTPDQRLRVFISSTLEELADERRAARAAVEQLRLAAVMFELGARPHPPRALYRSYLEQSDVFVGIYWQRYGWVAPDMSISGLEDEYVLSNGMPRLMYVKQPAQVEPRLGELLDRVRTEGSTSYKSFRDATELQQLLLDDLAVLLTERFNAPRDGPSPGEGRTNLPTQTTTFIGREALLSQLDALLDAGVRLLTLLGPGGTGKTRLAVRVATEWVGDFRDGVQFADLSAERDPDSAFAAIARTLAIGPIGDAPVLDLLARELRDANLLLVLDSCDHVVDAASGLGSLLERCPGLTILATSRVALKVRGEQLFPVPPLTPTEAVELFVDRAQAVRPDFELTETDASHLDAICTRLDGLPLAIELAAARVNLFGLDELHARLDERLDLLRSAARDLPERQRSLRSTLEWSRELLTPTESQVLALFSVFDGARLTDVEGVARRVPGVDEITVVETLGSLVDKSLVRSTNGADGRPRFSMLQTIRAYATEQLDADAALADAARRAHAEHHTTHAVELLDVRDAEDRRLVLAQLEADLGNLRAAWSHWLGAHDIENLDRLLEPLWTYYDARGDYRSTSELSTELLAVLATQPESPERTRDENAIKMSTARALVATQGFTVESEEMMRAALAQSEDLGDEQRFPTLRCLASLHMMRTDFARSAEVSRELLVIAERENDPALLSDAHLLVGVNSMRHSGFDVALEHVGRAVELDEQSRSGSVRFRVGAHPKVIANTVKGLLLWLRGSPDSAVAQVAHSLELAGDLGHPYSSCYALFHAGLLDLWREDIDALSGRAEELLTIADAHDYPIWRALGIVLRGVVEVASGDPEAGLDDLDHGFELYEGLSTPPVFWPGLLMIRAASSASAGRLDDARALLDDAAHVMRDDDPLAGDLALARGDVALALDPSDITNAEHLLEHAWDVAGAHDGRLVQLQAATRLLHLRRGTPQEDEARSRLRTILEEITEGSATPQVMAAHAALRDA